MIIDYRVHDIAIAEIMATTLNALMDYTSHCYKTRFANLDPLDAHRACVSDPLIKQLKANLVQLEMTSVEMPRFFLEKTNSAAQSEAHNIPAL